MNRNSLIKHIDLWKAKLGSYNNVAIKIGINAGALSTIMSGKYGANEATMLQKIAKALSYKEDNWQIVRTTGDYKRVKQLFEDAKNESMWFGLSNKAGGGKTCPMEDFFNQDTTGSVCFIQCEEWSPRQFLMKLIEKTIGESVLKGKYKTLAQLTDLVVNYFNDMSLEKPVLLIDEGDKLRPSAVRVFIPIYNRTQGRLGLILSGSENLEKEIKAGVRLRKKGYDELDSRLGRTYISLKGVVEREAKEICFANGIQDDETATRIWFKLPKVEKYTKVKLQGGTTKEIMLPYVEDLRLLERLIKSENLTRKRA